MSPRARYLLVAFCLVAAIVCVRLGVWQRDRLRERRARNATALAARNLPEVTVGREGAPASLADRRVVATGEYDRGHELVVRGESYNGVPGVLVVTPLRIVGSDSAVLVARGFVPAPDAMRATLDSLDEPGRVTVQGLAQPLTPGDGMPITHGAQTTWRRLDLDLVRRALPYPILPIVVRQTPDSSLPHFPRRLAAPALDDGPHLSYAIQWFSFAVIALVFAGVSFSRR